MARTTGFVPLVLFVPVLLAAGCTSLGERRLRYHDEYDAQGPATKAFRGARVFPDGREDEVAATVRIEAAPRVPDASAAEVARAWLTNLAPRCGLGPLGPHRVVGVEETPKRLKLLVDEQPAGMKFTLEFRRGRGLTRLKVYLADGSVLELHQAENKETK